MASVAFQMCARCGTSVVLLSAAHPLQRWSLWDNSATVPWVKTGYLLHHPAKSNRCFWCVTHHPSLRTVQNPSSRRHGSIAPPNHSVAHTAAIKEPLAPKKHHQCGSVSDSCRTAHQVPQVSSDSKAIIAGSRAAVGSNVPSAEPATPQM